jgi:hypothetical protein
MSKGERQRIENRIKKNELEIAGLESELKSLENALANPPADGAEVLRLSSVYSDVQGKLEKLMQAWSIEHEKLED